MKFLKTLWAKRLSFTTLIAFVVWQALLIAGGNHTSFFTFVLGLVFCGLVPGLLMTSALGAKRLTLQTLLYAIGLSIMFIISVGVIANYLPLLFGNKRPLSFTSVLLVYDSLLALSYAAAYRAQKRLPRLAVPKVKLNLPTIVVYSVALIGVAASIFGTIRLNNGADNYLSAFGLCLLILNIGLVFLWRKRLPLHAYVIAIAGLTWGLLLLTSLRSSYISGQDLKQEFRVYNITDSAHYWSMGNFRDSYNACLSITLYPFVVAKLLGISAALTFKVVFQLIFVACPLAVFALLRSKFGKNLALLGTIFFLSLPTVGLDLPLQTRQQMAFLLFSLVMLTWFQHSEAWIKKHWRLLFIIFSFGVVVSHYSTSYLFVGTLIINYLLRTALLLTPYAKKHKLSKAFTLPGRVVLLVCLFAFFWLGQATGASSNLVDKLSASVSTFTAKSSSSANSDTILDKDSDIKNVPVLKGHAAALNSYVFKTRAPRTTVDPAAAGEIRPTDDTLQPMPLLKKLPGSVQSLLKALSQNLYYVTGVALLPLIIMIGLVSLLLRRKSLPIKFPAKIEYLVLSVSMLAIIAVQVILPNISADYGITRALIQGFMILCIPFMFGLLELMKLVSFKINYRVSQFAMVIVAVVLFCTYSGLTAQALGGLRPQLNLNNSGPYYGAFYVRNSDIQAYNWIQNHVPYSGNVNSPDYSFPTALAYYPTYRHYGGGVFPFQVTAGHYILLNYAQTHEDTSYLTGSILAVKINQHDYDTNAIIYSNAGSELFAGK